MTAECILASFADQARSCDMLGSPFTARLLQVLAGRLQHGGAVADRVLGWSGDPSSVADALAIRLAGGLHALVLSGQDAALAEVYADPAADDARLGGAAEDALNVHAGFLLDWLKSPPQTNEVRRSVGLIAAGHWLTKHYGLPLRLSELGASAGLNLLWDHYALDIGGRIYGPADAVITLKPDWQGDLPPRANPVIAARAGVDLNPLDPVRDRLRSLAYVWADQKDRLQRTEIALSLAAALRPQIDRADAIDWLEEQLAVPSPGVVHLVYHTIAWQYFPSGHQARGEAAFHAAGARATIDAPLAHLSMEADDTPGNAALTLWIWPEGKVIRLGRVDFHGRWIRWDAPPATPYVSGP
jgi:hypothetical protein